jgi:hypothetical protein
MTVPDRPPSPERNSRSDEDRQLATAEMMIGTAMMFTGFVTVLLSISGGFEISILPLILYFAGLAIWAHATIANPTIRYAIMTASIALGIAFFHYGEVLFWHKQVIFWGTVLLVGYFMFTTEKTRKSK